RRGGGVVDGAFCCVVVARGEEDPPPCRNDRSAVIFASGVFHACSGQFGIFAERNFPEVFAGIEVDGIESAPRRQNGGVAVGIKKAGIAGEGVLHRRGLRAGGDVFFFWWCWRARVGVAGCREIGEGGGL